MSKKPPRSSFRSRSRHAPKQRVKADRVTPDEVRQAFAEAAAYERAVLGEDAEPDPAHLTLWHKFLPHRSVHAMYGRPDEVTNRMDTFFFLEPPVRARRIRASPPWATS